MFANNFTRGYTKRPSLHTFAARLTTLSFSWHSHLPASWTTSRSCCPTLALSSFLILVTASTTVGAPLLSNMCRYRYTYYSRCRHAEVYKVSYCDRAIELGLPQRDSHYSRDINLNATSAGPSAYSSPPAASTHSNSQHFIMSTLTPVKVGNTLDLVAMPQNGHPDQAAHHPRSIHPNMEHDAMQSFALVDTSSYNNVNIAIPLDSPSSLSMELTNDGKVTELVARFETYTEGEHSEASPATPGNRSRSSSLDINCSDNDKPDTCRLTPVPEVESPTGILSSPDVEMRKQRKPLPSEWTQTAQQAQTTPPTRRGAPLLQTELRSSKRDKRRSTNSSSPPKSLRGGRGCADLGKPNSFLTKEKSKPMSTSSSAPSTPGVRIPRSGVGSSASLPQSPSRGRLEHSILFPGSSTKVASGSGHCQSSSIQSSVDAEFYSAKESPVSRASSRSFTSCTLGSPFEENEENDDAIPHLDLAKADEMVQIIEQDGPNKSRFPKLSLTIPSGAHHHSAQAVGSASTLSSGSPTRSRIPRIHPKRSAAQSSPKTHSILRTKSMPKLAAGKQPNDSNEPALSPKDKESKDMPQSKTPVASRRVKTVDSTGATPIITRESLANKEPKPDAHTLVHSYLKQLPDQTTSPDTESVSSTEPQPDLEEVVGKMLSESIHAERAASPAVSPSTVTNAIAAQTATSDDTALSDPAVVYSRKRSTGSESKASSSHELPKTSETVAVVDSPVRGRGAAHEPNDRKQTLSQLSKALNSTFSELRATAPEFVPSEVNPPTRTNTWLSSLDPFAFDAYGIPWLYHMHPAFVGNLPKTWKGGKKSKTMPRGRKQGGNESASPSPTKILDALKKAVQEPDVDTSSVKAQPFAAQFDEIDRSAKDLGHSRGTSSSQTFPNIRGRNFRRSTRRHAGNGLYDNFARSTLGNGIPLDQCIPFPDPTPPSGTASARVGRVVEQSKLGCGSTIVEIANEWGGMVACNSCDPDH
ncbi:unnamed protein product [Periconia digitata]|uniref:Uncharacterized protein n=1 Tax=Periconia digitata TaxID=1303443 RepID=A0A9W4UDX4_9PLEO|nr:unnamed protein product [Periconia digitata]